MSRIPTPETIADAPEAARPLLNAVKSKIGFAPNLYKLLANSPAGLKATLNLSGALGEGELDPVLREQIALAVANVNGCSYCNSAHTALARNLGIGDAEISLNRRGRSRYPRTDAGLCFARQVAENRGQINDYDVQAVRHAGFADAEVIEIVLHVALNTLTNYANIVFQTENDFQAVDASRAAA